MVRHWNPFSENPELKSVRSPCMHAGNWVLCAESETFGEIVLLKMSLVMLKKKNYIYQVQNQILNSKATFQHTGHCKCLDSRTFQLSCWNS